MKLEPCDIENILIDLRFFFTENPKYTLPPRFVWVLSKIVQEQLDKITHKSDTAD